MILPVHVKWFWFTTCPRFFGASPTPSCDNQKLWSAVYSVFAQWRQCDPAWNHPGRDKTSQEEGRVGRESAGPRSAIVVSLD
jgi:hypothetical protein